MFWQGHPFLGEAENATGPCPRADICYGLGMSQPLRMVACTGCGTKAFIPNDLPPLATSPCPKCGHKLMMPMQLRQFELRGIIGSGGMGNVYRAFDNMLQREVAVKLMKKELASDATSVESFAREARACA